MCVRSHLYLSGMLARSRCCAETGTRNTTRAHARAMRRTIPAPFQGVLYNRSMQAPSTPTPSTPIIVKIVETNEISGLGDTMLEAIGLTGVIAVGAALFGLVLAVIIVSYRKIQARLHPDEDAQTQPLGLTPTGHQ